MIFYRVSDTANPYRVSDTHLTATPHHNQQLQNIPTATSITTYHDMKISIKDFSFVRISSRLIRAYLCGIPAATFELSTRGTWGLKDWTCHADFLQFLGYAFEDYIAPHA